ncbi:hypothetical protein FRACA_1550002 [Frankia canadensis]|uniref:Uncharacterized protein n=1 Tax=Frankia canadensis TaxID=1836972 RepID=A0A2I2KM89_9ACTN|nr:hypothetical protein FRACA_1550002 [Frankia canadensis]SOU54062.1 hypothetical protein FRACA_1550002 [Frankia canadensis]
MPMARPHRRVGMGSEDLLDALLPERDRRRDDVLAAARSTPPEPTPLARSWWATHPGTSSPPAEPAWTASP